MTDVKITELTAVSPVEETDIFPIVSDPAGTPVTKKATVKTVLDTRLNYSIVPAGDNALTAGTAAQAVFPSGGDVFTLLAETTYEFEGQYYITKSGTTCTVALLLALAGGATITSILYEVNAQNGTINTTAASGNKTFINQVSATVVNPTSTGDVLIKFKGLIRMNIAGTVTPQIQFSAAPTSPVMKANSFIKFTPIGTNVENTKGVVA